MAASFVEIDLAASLSARNLIRWDDLFRATGLRIMIGMSRFCCLLALLPCLAAIPALADNSCAPDAATPVQVTAVDDRLEMLLADGRRIVLAGVEPVLAKQHPALAMNARQRLVSLVQGRGVGLHLLVDRPDRWGRFPATVFAPVGEGAAAPVSLAQELITNGLARVRVSTPNPCQQALLNAETDARNSGRALWADPAFAVIDAANREAFAGKEGSVVIVEGTVQAIGSSGYRTYLNFGPDRFRDFSVTILKPALKLFDKAGLSLHSLVGQRLRVRGLLDLRFGPQMEIGDPAGVEQLGRDVLVQETIK